MDGRVQVGGHAPPGSLLESFYERERIGTSFYHELEGADPRKHAQVNQLALVAQVDRATAS